MSSLKPLRGSCDADQPWSWRAGASALGRYRDLYAHRSQALLPQITRLVRIWRASRLTCVATGTPVHRSRTRRSAASPRLQKGSRFHPAGRPLHTCKRVVFGTSVPARRLSCVHTVAHNCVRCSCCLGFLFIDFPRIAKSHFQLATLAIIGRRLSLRPRPDWSRTASNAGLSCYRHPTEGTPLPEGACPGEVAH